MTEAEAAALAQAVIAANEAVARVPDADNAPAVA
jgi:hypothetical protein